MLTVALSKGYLLKEALELFEKIGIACDKIDDRKLIFFDKTEQYRFMILRPTDVPVYVEHGTADIGITGKDVLIEANRDIAELVDLKFSKCDLIVAAPKGYSKGYFNDMKVATKFTRSAADFFNKKGLKVELIKLYGSVEVAPLVNLSDIIVDIAATGKTLKENGLEIIDSIYTATARLVANKSGLYLKQKQICDLAERLKSLI